MSYPLWKYFFDDDIDGFRQYLAKATFDRNASKAVGGANIGSLKVGSPGALASSPNVPLKSKKTASKLVLTRSDVNARDGFGRTLLHHAVSSHNENALEFVRALIEIPLLDLYVQDMESGWTALHRALYFGNIAAAQLLMVKDIQNATDYTMNVSHANAGGLVKIKDHEGNSPFEVFSLTTAPRDISQPSNALDALETSSVQSIDMDDGSTNKPRETGPLRVLDGDEVFAFGSNKNITLGLGDGDDRTFPERIQLRRPEHLSQRLFEDYQQQREKESVNNEPVGGMSELQEIPIVIRSMPIVVQDVVMSKLHTAILTRDPISNLHICGFGPGGRLGTGDEATRFNFECIQGGGLAKRRVASIALGQDHTVAVCTSGEVFTWGSNKFGQLGYELPEVTAQETPTQLTPRQIYGLIKKEQIIGAAASSIHSAIYTASGLYTFGKNDGQLGLMDADARSLEIQLLPRRVGVSVIQHAIQSVEAIDRATTILMENHEVIVFTHYGWTKVVFPLESFGSSIASDAFFARHQRQTKHISKITSGGNTICAMTSYGEVFTVDVPKHAEVGSNKSTTNPTKARNALPIPSKIWSIRKAHMAATDAAVGQDGSIILCTTVGTVWKKEKRANIKSVQSGNSKPKLYKFVRVPNIFRAVAVRSNAFGAFTAIRKDCDVMREQIVIGPPVLWDDMFNLLAFRDFGQHANDEIAAEPQLRYWKPATKGSCPALIKRALLTNGDAEEEFMHITKRFDPLAGSDYDVWVTSNVTDVRLPVHSLVLKARSKILRRALAEFQESYYYSITDVVAIEYGPDGHIHLCLKGADFLTLANFVFYLYTDTLADVWRFTSKALHLAPRYRGVRTELMKVALALDMRHLERAVRVMDEPIRCMRDDFETAFHDSDLFSDADVVVDLADGEERYAHSIVLQSRCPFFEGMFQGHTGGMWMADRRQAGSDSPEAIRVDLKHVTSETFELVLRHIYADTGDELFDAIVAKDLDEFVDVVIEVMAVANELMLDRLARVCQQVIGRYVTPWNICGLLNTIAESSENQFKLAGLEYVGLNLENMLDQRLLEELDEYLLEEMSETVHENQLAYMPIARSGRAMALLLEENSGLAELLELNRQRRLDSMRLPSRYVGETVRPMLNVRSSSLRGASETKAGSKVTSHKSSPTDSPALAPLDDMQFAMDDVNGSRPKSRVSPQSSPDIQATDDLDQNASARQSDFALQSGLNIGQPSISSTPQTGSLRDASFSIGMSSTKARTTWATPTSAPSLGLKDIMLQDSSVKISNLTQSLQRAAASSSKQSTPKVSQKERKRQQHEQKNQAQNELLAHEQQSLPVHKVREGAPQSPWQKVASTPDPQPVQSKFEKISSETPSASTKKDETKASQPRVDKENKKPSTPGRSVSSPGMTGASNAPPPQIQSIRHTPAPERSTSWLDARTSMSDILSQQQYEKIAIREFADKRSLQEIQQEQEFQEWWDNESRKIQEEEAAATAAAVRVAKGSRGRGGRRKVSGRQDSKPNPSDPKQQQQVEVGTVSQNAGSSRSESSSRGKPRHRGGGSQRGERGGSSS